MVSITVQTRALAAVVGTRPERMQAGRSGNAPHVIEPPARWSGRALPHVPGGALPWAVDAQRRRQTIERSFASANTASQSLQDALTRWLAKAVESLRLRVRGIEQ